MAAYIHILVCLSVRILGCQICLPTLFIGFKIKYINAECEQLEVEFLMF